MYIYIYPQAAWFAVSVNVYVGSFEGFFFGVVLSPALFAMRFTVERLRDKCFFQGGNVTLLFFSMRRQNALGRQRLKPKAANVQVLPAAALHRHPGLKTVLKAALQVYRQACSKGTVQTNPANFLQQRTGMI